MIIIKLVTGLIKRDADSNKSKLIIKRDSDCDGSPDCDCDQCWDAQQP